MKVGDLVMWTGKEEKGCIGIIEEIDEGYIYVRWADGNLDDYYIDDEIMLKYLELLKTDKKCP